MSRKRNLRILAWGLGLSGAVVSTLTVALTVGLGLYSVHVLLYAAFIAAGILGALVASRETHNSVGWLMCVASLAAALYYGPVDYGYVALVLESGSWPLGGVALWLGAWAWAPLLGLFIPLLTVRFPDGRVPRRWRAVDWLAVGGTLCFAVGVAFAPHEVNARFLQVPARVNSLLANPFGATMPADLARVIVDAGLALILLGYLLAVMSVIDRFRHARDEKRLQLKWFAYAGVAVIVAEICGAAALIGGWQLGTDFEIAVHLATFALPVAITIAILHYRLYDIDVLINRTIVYGGMTAILAATYTAGITFLQRLFMAVTGQRSDAAYVLTAFAIVVGFTPVKSWLQARVDRRMGNHNPSAVLGEFSAEVEAVVSVIDVHRVARRLLEQAVVAFDARGASLFLGPNGASTAIYSRGSVKGDGCIGVPLRYEDRQFGHLLLGSRRGGASYSKRDRELLQRSADSVGDALALAEHLGFRPLPTSARGQ
ncbi:MAG TPA: GAF domain-containing protein [Candidatus Dormibacteraeota bacterium]|nr:GAF domain-containing protein [Candidatus Dormibacteraeota bacterium]